MNKTHGKNGVPELKAITGDKMTQYRTLKQNELTKEGDEFEVDGDWFKSNITGSTPKKMELTYRRPIAKPKYRILKNNETIRVGDQGYDSWTRGWWKVMSDYVVVGRKVTAWSTTRFRRKVK
jgi:hypothetical protein